MGENYTALQIGMHMYGLDSLYIITLRQKYTYINIETFHIVTS